ncbi:HNH endonuclease signature motif containing protein [Salinicoccus luteus]|uniref:HNH endonuclease signature motif containing protein n=1 Tax=Salinicoccus luteus TaxID=367840 RepID=UPI0004E1C8AF|nr:HNH endonuclease signature motif containing protein [Salinicoccus luteus]
MKMLNPGNYFLTKSMEWTTKKHKIDGEYIEVGVYWYLKKFLTFYHYIFDLKQSLSNDSTYREITRIFDDYIKSLPKDLQNDAKKYFYAKNIKTFHNVIKWNEFYRNEIAFENEKENYNHKLLAQKLYMVYLLDIGGQGGLKKFILKDLMNAKVSFEKLPVHIYETNSYDQFFKEHDIELMRNSDRSNYKNSKIRQQVNDATAPLRNIRQLLSHFGLLYESNMTSLENFSLTVIGKSILEANYLETALIMEHQKIKMISQPPVITISDLQEDAPFFIELNPYLKILKYLYNNQSITYKDYQYKISRHVSQTLPTSEVEEHVKNFDRKADNTTEDFNKEIKKYMYGITSVNLPELNVVSHNSRNSSSSSTASFTLNSKQQLEQYINLIKRYKVPKEKLIRKQVRNYKNIIVNGKRRDFQKLSSWYSHITSINYTLLLDLSMFSAGSDLEKIKKIKIELPNIYKMLVDEFGTALLKEVNEGKNKTDINYSQVIGNLYRDDITTDNIVKQKTETSIMEKSKLLNISDDKLNKLNSKRGHILYIKDYYSNNNVKTCDCCGEETFQKNSGEWYLEYHHLVPISRSGQDHVLNLYGICPNCHTGFHLAKEDYKSNLYTKIDENNYLNISIVDRYKHLVNIEMQALALDFLVTEKAITEEDHEDIILSRIV